MWPSKIKFHLEKIRSGSQSCQIFVNSLDLNLQTQAFHGSNVLLLKLFVDEVISDFIPSSESDPIRIFKSKTEFFNLALQKPENLLAESAAQVILVSSLAYLTRTKTLYGGDLEALVSIMRTVASRIQYRLQSSSNFHDKVKKCFYRHFSKYRNV